MGYREDTSRLSALNSQYLTVSAVPGICGQQGPCEPHFMPDERFNRFFLNRKKSLITHFIHPEWPYDYELSGGTPRTHPRSGSGCCAAQCLAGGAASHRKKNTAHHGPHPDEEDDGMPVIERFTTQLPLQMQRDEHKQRRGALQHEERPGETEKAWHGCDE